MAFIRDESAVTLKDESGNVLLDELGAEGETLTCTAGSLVLTGNTATLTVRTPLDCVAGELVLTGGTVTLTDDMTLYASAGQLVLTGNVVTLTTTADQARRTGGGYPWETGPAKRVQRKEREDRQQKIDRIVREAVAEMRGEMEAPVLPAGASGEPAAAAASSLPDGARRQAILEAAQRQAKAERFRVSLKALEARLDEVLRQEAEEDDLMVLLLAS